MRDSEVEGSDSGLKGARFEAVGVTVAFAAALVRGDSDVAFAFNEHGGVEKDLSDARKGFLEAFLENEIEE